VKLCPTRTPRDQLRCICLHREAVPAQHRGGYITRDSMLGFGYDSTVRQSGGEK